MAVRLGNYELLLELASGGMATVYVARQLGAAGFERFVVVKRVHPHLLKNHDFHTMFIDEARVASRVHHPNVVPVVDVVEAEGELFLVMEYVDSTTLATMRHHASESRKQLPPSVVSRIGLDVLAGLHAAHEALDMRGYPLFVVHRDVSPQNVLVGHDGIARLIDFGIAKAAHRATETRTGSLKGKYGYMSPEQTHALDIDRRSDVFAAAVVLHEALTGRRLFTADNEIETVRRVNEMPIPDVSTLAPDVGPQVDAVLRRALARDRSERYATAAELAEALERVLPPASHRDVARVVEALAGERLRERRAVLQGILAAQSQAATAPGTAGGSQVPPVTEPAVATASSGVVPPTRPPPSIDGKRFGVVSAIFVAFSLGMVAVIVFFVRGGRVVVVSGAAPPQETTSTPTSTSTSASTPTPTSTSTPTSTPTSTSDADAGSRHVAAPPAHRIKPLEIERAR